MAQNEPRNKHHIIASFVVGCSSIANENWSIQMEIQRLPGKALGRTAGSAFGSVVFIATVAHDRNADLVLQSSDLLSRLEEQLGALGSDKSCILSATVYLADMSRKSEFDQIWIEWVGEDQRHWPQRACVGAVLAEQTAVEISVIAVRRDEISA
ncbi:Rid family hydrolase [Mesorhizobium metallidurans]|uniref:Rid family hydrolase n=1 Tax=Mesorhizobium metallidurans TaxID=489722 RepID=UPI00034D7ABB|nr:Rid family hydrolase [Mesorhizobium metallidurans]